ncbi:alkaline phosphatase-like, partial [Lytechinus variegatus]|uniref:alkaline phosphatase-like n=1 Tax=Lytechinus variegatus TaxID=7654 RepID=UPI001BB2812E
YVVLSLSLLSIYLDANFWMNQGQETLRRALNRQDIRGIAKNVIFFLGDGMGITTTTAARIFRGQQAGKPGEEGSLAWDQFSHVALSKTYNTDQQIADSAGSATAFFCGIKTRSGLVGLDDSAERGNCESAKGAQVDSILVQAHRAGKSTGIVSTARVTHGTPAATYAHSPERDWENDSDIPQKEAETGCKDIARQLIEDNNFINVILGGGRNQFLPDVALDPEYGSENVTGLRKDGVDLVKYWLSEKGLSAKFVWNETAFKEVDILSTEYLLGLFEPGFMKFESLRATDKSGEPSLVEMTQTAIRLLSKDNDGYFLMVEAGRIDHGHHLGKAYLAFQDTIAFDEAVAKAVEMTSLEDTLIIVTADHGHSLSFGGVASRGNAILGYDDRDNGTDDLPYLTLTYANGPGGVKIAESYFQTGKRPNHFDSDYNANDFLQDAVAPLKYETHSGTDVAIYAQGPWAHLFHSTHEQNYIAHVVRYAACYVQGVENACTRSPEKLPFCTGHAHAIYATSLPYTLLLIVFTWLMGGRLFTVNNQLHLPGH